LARSGTTDSTALPSKRDDTDPGSSSFKMSKPPVVPMYMRVISTLLNVRRAAPEL
jgi:hypothetical protein